MIEIIKSAAVEINIDPKEVAVYLGYYSANGIDDKIITDGISEFLENADFRACCVKIPVSVTENGVTDFHMDEAALHRQMLKNARQAIVLADSTKIGSRAVVNVCPLEDIDILITDRDAPKQLVKMLEQAGVQVIIAE